MSITIERPAELRDWSIPDAGSLCSMLRRHPTSLKTKQIRILLRAADAGAVVLAGVLSWLIRGVVAGHELNSNRTLLFGLCCLPVWLITFSHYRLYSARKVASRIEESSRLVRAIIVSTAGIAVVSYAINFDASRGVVLLTAVLALPLCLAERELVRLGFRRARSAGRLRRRAVVIGSNEEAAALVRMFRTTPHLGYDPVGICADEDLPDVGLPWLGGVAAATQAVEAAGATTAVIATTSLSPERANYVVRRLHDAGIHVELSTGLQDIPAERLCVRDLGRHAVFYLEPTVLDGPRAVAKRAFDLTFSIVGLVLAAPLIAVCAVLVKLSTPGPALFHQERVGQGGKKFRIHKLRTMVADAEDQLDDLAELNEADGPLFKLCDDPRVTRIGKPLRSLSIDELPQLWNVVKGEMSLVGPRPALEAELAGWTPELRNRLRVKPGVTGMWQVSGRSMGNFGDYVRHDLFYVDNWTLLRDLEILAKTVPAVLLRRGAC